MTIGDWQDLAVIDGVEFAVAAAGIKYKDRKDVALILISEGASVAGVFTQNAFAAAPIDICRRHLSQSQQTRAFIINSGNANACTGAAGFTSAQKSCEAVAEKIGVSPQQVLPFSTGVIGSPLPVEKILAVVPELCEGASGSSWRPLAEAIMTTDTKPKGATRTLVLDQGNEVRISGVAKGAGMIKPNMATMLGFVATDARVAPAALTTLNRLAAQKSFNRISIDGDTSTNDACMLIATGKSKAAAIESEQDAGFSELLAGLIGVYESLAKQIVKDGEGATKFVEIEVNGGKSSQESLDVAYAIAHSPLVKTALFASDPNWGRIVAAIGNAGLDGLDPAGVSVWLDEVIIVDKGGVAASYTEERGKAVFNQAHFSIRVELGRGQAHERIWTSDLSHEYVRINAEYRT